MPQPFNRQTGHAPQPKPVVAQLKTGVSAQSIKRPIAPPVYRPQATPSAAQPKMANGAVNRKPPVAPPVYRPQQVPRVLQTKSSSAQGPQKGQAPRPAVAPAIYRPEQQRTAQPKMASAAQARTPPKAPPVYRPQPKQVNTQSRLPVQMKSQPFARPQRAVIQRRLIPVPEGLRAGLGLQGQIFTEKMSEQEVIQLYEHLTVASDNPIGDTPQAREEFQQQLQGVTIALVEALSGKEYAGERVLMGFHHTTNRITGPWDESRARTGNAMGAGAASSRVNELGDGVYVVPEKYIGDYDDFRSTTYLYKVFGVRGVEYGIKKDGNGHQKVLTANLTTLTFILYEERPPVASRMPIARQEEQASATSSFASPPIWNGQGEPPRDAEGKIHRSLF